MDIFLKEHKIFLLKLIENNITFILIGGHAVNFHGYGRPTGDMDIWVKPDNDEKLKLVELLRKEGFSEEGINTVSQFDFTKRVVFHFGDYPLRVDFLTFINIIKFDEAYEQKQLLPLGDKLIPVLNLHHLVLSKITTDRPKDKLDIDELQKANRGKI
ncbi:MAG: hypothetical protein ABI723_10900 [Bacteroidia bacterium]